MLQTNSAPIIEASAAFSRDRRAKGELLPANISLHELITAGYLRAEDFHILEGKETLVSVIAAGNTNSDNLLPGAILIRVKFSSGLDMALLADGSVQAITPDRK